MICFLVFCCLAGGCLGLEVRQFPSDVITKPGEVPISCTHNKTDYRVMLWYQRSHGDTAMKLIGYLNYADVKMEENYTREEFNISGDLSGTAAKKGSLVIKITQQKHSAVYYCAARQAL
ncbi:unnamed protein product [Scomber scombrus]|uniref:Unnamed protein product n=1 Tax=Scomber scombrus TaxID=13677 RepID=A0AAV1P426_SCOSC